MLTFHMPVPGSKFGYDHGNEYTPAFNGIEPPGDSALIMLCDMSFLKVSLVFIYFKYGHADQSICFMVADEIRGNITVYRLLTYYGAMTPYGNG